MENTLEYTPVINKTVGAVAGLVAKVYAHVLPDTRPVSFMFTDYNEVVNAVRLMHDNTSLYVGFRSGAYAPVLAKTITELHERAGGVGLQAVVNVTHTRGRLVV